MSSTSAPFGLKPLYHDSGEERPVTTNIDVAYTTNMYLYSPVKLVDGLLNLAAAGERAIGCFLGVRYVDVNGRPVFSNKWVAQSGATDIVGWYTRDPYIVYEIQANATLTIEAVGEQYDWSTNNTNSGNLTTGLSSVTLNVASAAANAGLRVIGLTESPVNAWGDSFPVVQVQISEHQNVADVAAY
jgi:hypothetical protein